jgi:hypothetical protein
MTTIDPIALLHDIVTAYDALVSVEIAGRPDVLEATRGKLADLITLARTSFPDPARRRR